MRYVRCCERTGVSRPLLLDRSGDSACLASRKLGVQVSSVPLSKYSRIAQLVERLTVNQEVAGSSPVPRVIDAVIAQLVVRLPCKQQVVGSSPTGGSAA